MKRAKKLTDHLSDGDYRTLAAIRATMRRFMHFSEGAAKAAGLTPQQHQALLAIRATNGSALFVGDLAELLLIKPHSASELVDRLVTIGLVTREQYAQDRRTIKLSLTKAAEQILSSLSVVHRDELRALRPLLGELLASLN